MEASLGQGFSEHTHLMNAYINRLPDVESFLSRMENAKNDYEEEFDNQQERLLKLIKSRETSAKK